MQTESVLLMLPLDEHYNQSCRSKYALYNALYAVVINAVLYVVYIQKWLETINAQSAPRCEVCRYHIRTRKMYRV